MKEPTAIYAYSSFGEYFAAYVQSRKATDASFSLRSLSRHLKLKSPSLLAMVARGEREPTPALLHRLCTHLALKEPEVRYAELLVGLRRAKVIDEQLRCARELRRFQPLNDELVLELETLEMVAKWYAAVIIELTKLPSFTPDAAWIADQLGPTVSADMVCDMLGTLERIGAIRRTESGSWQKTVDVVRLSTKVPSTAIRSFHKQVLLRAHQAIDRQALTERYFTSITIAVPSDRINEAGRLIAQFRNDFMKLMTAEPNPPAEVYHLAVQFFRATEAQAKPATLDSTL